jgi:hypothetical protein
MPLKHRHPLTPNNPTGNTIIRLTASLKTLFHNRHAKYTKIGVFPREFTHRLSHELPVDGNRCPSNTGTLRRQTTRPEILFRLTASLKTLFHNRHAKYTKIGVFPTEFTHRLSHRPAVHGAVDVPQTPALYDAEQTDRKYYSP